jgi:Arc/MetJ-type ribon-helix-helix transcriptional regulator
MRQVVSLSLPQETVLEVEKIVKKEKFKNVSEFIRSLIKMYQSDEFLFRDIAEAEADVKAGRVYKVTTLKDLLK